MEVIQRKQQKEVPPGKKKRGVLTYLGAEDFQKLRRLVKLGNSNNSAVVRDSIRHAYLMEFGEGDDGGAA